ncbi:hypothetical protein P7228_02840 [Altererythrobacter arenosus]|uniref:RcnB family protein n=1 Tax=Altererythrobacter arenosus TaxID=3032592 RepID=A0ABY8FXN5_9SPHN|nr:hypothetical protein [Altererythrobacter sp. CAU 1644]WFL78021.1 hypothetical protein P7228_02840 [Altererythrobacter sp. CAU 1644]
MLRLLAGTAALALIAMPVHADPGNGKGNGKGKPAAAAQSQGGGKADRGGPDKARGKQDRGPSDQAERGNKQRANLDRGDRGKDRGPNFKPQHDRSDKPVFVGNGKDRGKDRGPDWNDGREWRDGDYAGGFLREALGVNRGVIDGCPPGLAKKRNGCLPPGQAKKMYSDYRPDFFGLRGLRDGRFFYNDGYLLRYGAGGLSGYIPLLGGALSIGNSWPNYYQPYELPRYYTDFYSLGGPGSYRYADNVIYRVDPESAAIMSVAALLTGDDFTIGQPMPRGYDVYNVPYAYRDRYYDSPEAHYRYSDGYIYRIDPETALITAAIDMLI